MEATNSEITVTYAGLEGEALVRVLLENFKGRVALVSSFGIESSVLLHMVSRIDPDTPVLFMETGRLFRETIAYRDELIAALGLTDVRSIVPDPDDVRLFDPQGNLHRSDPDTCCIVRKRWPLDRALETFKVVLSGRKRFHGGARVDLPALQVQGEILKVDPLVSFSAEALRAYMQEHGLKAHPLEARGYFSVGCVPCTARAGSLHDPRAGRWPGFEKNECGMHGAADLGPRRH